ncbi:unnamed protein product [Paramecium sonneborni]|uniref:Uncharacterized protein n=1 Tax=Paramecium sonneborni TaxID=65129 RepID=A0A8S1RHI7_9CILI|nr:unnamed protein product [Paramecium sonneborni]
MTHQDTESRHMIKQVQDLFFFLISISYVQLKINQKKTKSQVEIGPQKESLIYKLQQFKKGASHNQYAKSQIYSE